MFYFGTPLGWKITPGWGFKVRMNEELDADEKIQEMRKRFLRSLDKMKIET